MMAFTHAGGCPEFYVNGVSLCIGLMSLPINPGDNTAQHPGGDDG